MPIHFQDPSTITSPTAHIKFSQIKEKAKRELIKQMFSGSPSPEFFTAIHEINDWNIVIVDKLIKKYPKCIPTPLRGKEISADFVGEGWVVFFH